VGKAVIAKGRLIPFPGATISLVAPPGGSASPVRDFVSLTADILVPLQMTFNIQAFDDEGSEGEIRTVALMRPDAREESLWETTIQVPRITREAIGAWWEAAQRPGERLVIEAKCLVPAEIEGLDSGLTFHGRSRVEVTRDEDGCWIDSANITLRAEAPLTGRIDAEFGDATLNVHWSPWAVVGNPISALLQRSLDGFRAAGWKVEYLSDHFTERMQAHYRN
jgi:hypothetical protein